MIVKCMIAAAARLLAPGGHLYIDVPNEPNLLTYLGNTASRLMGKRGVYNLSPTWSPYHVYGFNLKALRTLLRKHGFTIYSSQVLSGTRFPSQGRGMDRVKAFIATQLVHVGNATRTADNMTVWAKLVD